MTPPGAAATARPSRPVRSPRPGQLRPTARPRRRALQRVGAAPRGLASAPRPAPTVAGALTGRSLLDRLIDSRIWIALVASALIGIVATQLWVLKLNSGIGRAITHESLLQRENASLSRIDAELSAGDRVERYAQAEGMVIVPPGAVRFTYSRGALDTRLAAAALARPAQTPSSSAAVAAGESSPSSATVAAGESSPSSATAAPTGSAGGEAAQVAPSSAAAAPATTPPVATTTTEAPQG